MLSIIQSNRNSVFGYTTYTSTIYYQKLVMFPPIPYRNKQTNKDIQNKNGINSFRKTVHMTRPAQIGILKSSSRAVVTFLCIAWK